MSADGADPAGGPDEADQVDPNRAETSGTARRRRAPQRRGPSFVPPPPPYREPASPLAGPPQQQPRASADRDGPPVQWAGTAAGPPPSGPRPDPPAGAGDRVGPPPGTWPARTGQPAPAAPAPTPAATRQNQPWQYAVLGGLIAVVLYYLIKGGSLGRDQLIFFGVLVPSIILHEVSHGAVALLFGDDTAKRAGRLTLNPIKHIDPFWTIILPAMMVMYTGTAFGMAKPVPVNQRRMRSPRNHGMLTALAGPATNILIAVLALIAYRALYADLGAQLFTIGGVVHLGFRREVPLGAEILFTLGLANAILAAFNLIPIPPLDGSSVIERILPAPLLEPYLRLRQFSFFLFIGLYLLGANAFGRILSPVVDLWYRLIAG